MSISARLPGPIGALDDRRGKCRTRVSLFWRKAIPTPVLTLYRYRAFDDALETVAGILDYQGNGHSCGIHSENGQHILALAHSLVG